MRESSERDTNEALAERVAERVAELKRTAKWALNNPPLNTRTISQRRAAHYRSERIKNVLYAVGTLAAMIGMGVMLGWRG